MKLRSLAVNQFKKFTQPIRVDGIGDGLNVLVGPNEMGKSTLLDALRAALFEKHSSRAHTIVDLQNDRNLAGPVVELAFEMDDGLYRITKRFLKKPYARLLCPDSRTLEGDAAEDVLRKLLGFEEPGKTGAKPETLGMWNVLWVQQGQSFGAPEIPGSARSSLHSALEAEVGTILGGRRGRELPKIIEDQLGTLVTKATDKPRGAYKNVIDHVESLRQEIESLSQRRQALFRDLEDLASKQETIGRLSTPAQDKADQTELEDTRGRFTKLSKLEAEIKSASNELALKQNKFSQAKKELEERDKLRKDLGTEKAAFEESGKRLSEAIKEENSARTGLEDLRKKAHEAETAVNKADEEVSRFQRILGAVDSNARIHELTGRWEKSKDAEERQSAARQKASAILVSESLIISIRQAAKELELITGQLRASATRIFFDLNPGQQDGIEVNGHPLVPEQTSTHAVEPTTIFIPERGRITIEPAIKDRDKLLQKYRAAETRHKKYLLEASAVTLEDAESLFDRRSRLLQEAELARKEAELHAPATDDYEAGAQALFDHIQGLTTSLNREKGELHLEKLPARPEAEKVLALSQKKAKELREARQSAQDALTEPQATIERLNIELARTTADHEETEKRWKKLQLQLKNLELECSAEILEEAIKTTQAAVLEQERTLAELSGQRTEETLPLLDARIKRLENALKDREQKRSTLNADISGLKARISVAEGDGLDELIERKNRELALGEEEKHRLDREVKVLKLLLSTLRDAEQKAKERFLSPVIRRVRPYLQILFPNSDLILDEDLRITGVMRDGGYEESFEHLSMGTQEQIAVLIRLAFAEMLVEQGHPATVILDDALVFSDDRRIRRMFDVLNHASQKVQVLVLTCREQLFEELGGRSLFLKPGNPDDLLSA